MDILYVIGTGSHWDNNELRYSMRSIEKNCTGIDNVFVVGEKPKFVNWDEVGYIFCKDVYGPCYPHNNIHRKVEVAMSAGVLSEHFLIMSDDQYYIRPTDFNDYPLFSRRDEIPTEVPQGYKKNTYWDSLFETRRFLEKRGLPIFQTNPHCAKHIVAEVWRDNKKLFDDAINLKHGGEINLIMGNLLIANGIKPQPIVDCKVFRYDNRDQLELKLRDRHVFSISDRSLECGMKQYLNELYPDKSKYEL